MNTHQTEGSRPVRRGAYPELTVSAVVVGYAIGGMNRRIHRVCQFDFGILDRGIRTGGDPRLGHSARVTSTLEHSREQHQSDHCFGS